ncbi:hypothetical protein GBA52_001749 [Prunus armeniaca]|nr:hypothetical protein GBA52_001749 [Prunus armeniaca]
MNVPIVAAMDVARAFAFAQGQVATDGSFFICHRQPLFGNSYRSTTRVSSLHHPH